MVIFLVGLVSMILMRTLRKDYARYSKEEEMDDMVSFVDFCGCWTAGFRLLFFWMISLTHRLRPTTRTETLEMNTGGSRYTAMYLDRQATH